MIHLHDKNKKKIAGLIDYKDLFIESELQSGEKTLCFYYPKKANYYFDIVEECYIRTKENEYIVKERIVQNEYTEFKCILNLEDIEGKPFSKFESKEQTIDKALALALAGTGWVVGKCDLKKKRTVRMTNCSSLEIVQEIKKIYRCDIVFNTLSKTIDVYEHLGEDKGTYFIDSLNLKSLAIQGSSYGYFTRLIPIGKDDLKITDINDKKEYVENYQYSNKIKTAYWIDDRYTVKEHLKDDAIAKLNEISKPFRSYSAAILNLAKLNNKYKNILDYKLGDTINLISKEDKFKDKQRIVKMIEFPDEHERDSVELSNTTLCFEDIQTQFQEAADTVDNITTDNGTIKGSTIDSIETKQIKDFYKEVIEATNIKAINAKIINLEAQDVTISGQLTAVNAQIGSLTTNVATIDKLVVKHDASITNLNANKASITDLHATNATIQVLEANVGNIRTLVNGNLSSENIQVGGITGDRLNMKTIFVDDANIVSINASKINAGEISTNKVKIKSDDGGIEIIGTTLQFKDKNNKVRIQMGKDAKGDFNFIIIGEDGKSVLIDNTGVKEKAITNDLIKSNMIASNAVGEKQIDYSSFSEGFNKDTNAHTLNATKIKLNNQNQTLDVAFNSLKKQSDSNKTLTENHSTTINIMQGKISTAINNTQIVKDGKTVLLKDDYNRTVETVSSLKSTIGKHTTLIDRQTGLITGVTTKVNNFERDLNGLSLTVSETKTKLDNLQIGGRNLLLNSDFKEGLKHYSIKNTGKNGTIEVVEFQGRKCLKFTNVGYWDVSKYLSSPDYKIPTGQKVNFSADIYLTSGDCISVDFSGVLDKGDNYIKVPSLNKWHRLSTTSTVSSSSDGISGFSLYSGSRTKTISGYMSLLKAEIGDKATDWSPAPEDIQAEITTTNSKISTIDMKLGSITSKVNAVEANNQNLAGQVSGLNIWKAEAEQKITKAAIISTVNSEFYTKGQTDSMYATQSQFKQFSNRFEFQIQNTGRSQLIPNGDFRNGWNFWKVWNSKKTLEFISLTETYILRVEPTQTNGHVTFGIQVPAFSMETNKTYTLAFWVESPIIKDLNYNFIMSNDIGAYRLGNVSFDTKDGIMTRVSITFTAKSTTTMNIMLGWEGEYRPGLYFHIKEACCFEGNVAYPYKSCDDEIYAGITFVDQTGIGVKHMDGSYSKMTADSVVFTNVQQQKKMAIKKGSLYAYDVNNGDLLGMFASNKVTSHYRGITTGLTGSAHYFAIGATTELTDDDQLNMVPYILIAQQDLHNFLGNSIISGGINFMNTPCIFHQSALFNTSPRFKGGFTILKSDDSLLNIYHAKNSIYIESNLTLPTGGSFYGGGLYGGDTTSIGYLLNGKYKDVIKLYANIQQIDFLRPLNMNGFGIYNATLAASYSLNSTSPGRSVGADTASVETMLLQEDFSKYDEENNTVVVNINEAVKSIYEKNKILENENEKLKQDKENLIKELDMTKNVVDNLLMGVS
ncbi:phage tail protein [Paraclostridium sordellii]|uniref:phage tail protein n=2 Tax=Paraclostridium sordellii TaxID=1505 RepID=UPI0005E1AF54|nr:phage tail protein [Paeniclostridium sordellii]CEO07676.1 phage minor structural protein [[Clostridium] sordellii] [Paeniclostridium sordellii]